MMLGAKEAQGARSTRKRGAGTRKARDSARRWFGDLTATVGSAEELSREVVLGCTVAACGEDAETASAHLDVLDRRVAGTRGALRELESRGAALEASITRADDNTSSGEGSGEGSGAAGYARSPRGAAPGTLRGSPAST